MKRHVSMHENSDEVSATGRPERTGRQRHLEIYFCLPHTKRPVVPIVKNSDSRRMVDDCKIQRLIGRKVCGVPAAQPVMPR